jgi:hypothetical protein
MARTVARCSSHEGGGQVPRWSITRAIEIAAFLNLNFFVFRNSAQGRSTDFYSTLVRFYSTLRVEQNSS